MPVPLIRSLGVGGLLIPFASIVAAVTLLPVLLLLLGARGVRRRPTRACAERRVGGWARLARVVMRRPVVFLTVGTALLVAAAIPALALELTPGSISASRGSPESVRAYESSPQEHRCRRDHTRARRGGRGRSPKGCTEPQVRRAVDRLSDLVFHDPEMKVVAPG